MDGERTGDGADVAPADARARRPMLLGIDTGGTFTDAVLISGREMPDGPSALIAKAKRATTHGALSIGIGAAIKAVLGQSGVAPAQVSLVSLSTTLATNALVEGHGGRAALAMIGFAEADLTRQGLGDAIGAAPFVAVAGGHDAAGAEVAPLETEALARWAGRIAAEGAEAVAVCAMFAVRNPAHERAAAEIIRAETGLPVTMSHGLSARVGGPRRALTALLNARLTVLIDRLIRATEGLLEASGIAAPLMIVRGDGALVAARFAAERPIETILSGPAASLVGAGWLTGLADAVVSDIGGTTTDISVLKGGRPRIDPDGARVGGHRTMVEAVAMATHGLGGDSEVRPLPGGGFALGPRRAVPISHLAAEHPGIVGEALARQSGAPRADAEAARFWVSAHGGAQATGAEADLMARLADGPLPVDALARERRLAAAARRLAGRGAIRQAAFTPTDAAHVTGRFAAWDAGPARVAADLLARVQGGDGRALAPTGWALSEAVLTRLERRSAEVVLDAALAEDGYPDGLATGSIAEAALEGRTGLVVPRITLSCPLIGLGASAASYYPGVARRLGAVSVVPEDADVANAVGAVVGHIRIERTATIALDGAGYRAHLPDGPSVFPTLEAAEDALGAALSCLVAAEAAAAGGDTPAIATEIVRREAPFGDRVVCIEAEMSVSAIARPRAAAPAEESQP